MTIVGDKQIVFWTFLFFLVTSVLAGEEAEVGTKIHSAEMERARRWAELKLNGTKKTESESERSWQLLTGAEILRDRCRDLPLCLKDQTFEKGILAHAPSEMEIRLPGPGKRFLAYCGIDSNVDTRSGGGGRGSVVFSVKVGGDEVWRSGTLREGMTPEVADIPLKGGDRLTLTVSDAGDGIGWDQADWAGAKITLEDGSEIWLSDIPAASREKADFPFSFEMDGVSSKTFLKTWNQTEKVEKIDSNRTRIVRTWRDGTTGLEVCCDGILYADFPTVEWTVYLKNIGEKKTPMISRLVGIDDDFFSPPGEPAFRLHYNVGSLCQRNDFQPFAETLDVGVTKTLASIGGRPTDGFLPYFNLETSSGGKTGVILVAGWPGQWSATFHRVSAEGVRVQIGQETTAFTLLPGEEVRTPLMVLQFYDGDPVRAQNVWRRWMGAYNIPKVGGQPIRCQLAGCAELMSEETTATLQKLLDGYEQNHYPLDYLVHDAGWYPCRTGWADVGTWEVDLKRYPKGLREISDRCRKLGYRFILWFEPERSIPGRQLAEEHPEFLLGSSDQTQLFNLGDPTARAWLTDHISQLITEQRVDYYRQDFNMEPLGYWKAADTPERVGMTENRHVVGYLAYWDELKRRHPDLLFDTCASGGRRLDLETLRRSVPILRSDYPLISNTDPLGNQCQTYGLVPWVPMEGTGSPILEDFYLLWSALQPHTTIAGVQNVKNHAAVLHVFDLWKRYVAPAYAGDFYPLTDYSLDENVWIAWQFDSPEKGDGIIQAFRRADAPYPALETRLRGLDPSKNYRLTVLQGGRNAGTPPLTRTEWSGKELLEKGLTLSLPERRDCLVLRYEAIPCPHPFSGPKKTERKSTMDLLEAITQRHSVRSYRNKPLDAETKKELERFIKEYNAESGLRMQLVTDEPKAFDCRLAHYGRFSGVTHYVVLIGKKSAHLDELCGYFGEKFVLQAQIMGLNTCWVGLTYKRIPGAFTVRPDEKLALLIAVGYGVTPGVASRSKKPSAVSSTRGVAPGWFQKGVEAALLAPTAINQQKFHFFLNGNKVLAKAGLGFYRKVDLGIVKYHFEIGAGRENFTWE